jgi:DNA transformation protein and related proteins
LAVSDDFRDYVLEQLAVAGKASARRMFGGVGLYLDGLFFALIADDTLYFKTDDTNKLRFVQAGSRQFCPFPDRPTHVMAYWEVPAEVLEDPEELRNWTREALSAALAARTKRSARRRRPAGRR